MIKALSGVYESNIVPGLSGARDNKNHQFSYSLPTGEIIKGYVDIKTGRTPKYELRSIYLDTKSF